MAENIDGRLNFKAVIDDSEYQKTVDKMEQSIIEVGKTFEKGTEKINEFTNVTAKSASSIDGLTNTLKKLKEGLGRATSQEEIVAFNRKITETQDAITKMSRAGTKGFDDLGNAIEKTVVKQSAFSKLTSLVREFAGAFGLFAGLGLAVSVIRNAIQSVFDFDKAMTNMSAIAGKNRKDLKDVEGVIREVASTSINSANEVANLATELIKLGSSTDEVKKLIKPVNDLSIAFNASAEDSATLVKSMLNAFGEGAEQAGRFTDILAAAANQTALGFQEIKEAFTYISPAASAAGYSLEQAASMAGVLVDNGIRASSAGRLLASTLGRLAGQGTDLETALDKVRNSSDKLATSTKIFGSESGKIGIILANNKDRLKELTTGFENAEGSLAILTEKQLKSLPAMVKMVTSAWEEFILGLDSGDGAISRVTKGMLEFTASLIQLISTQRTASKSMDDERVSLSMLVGDITKVNVTQAQRTALLEKLNNDYPAFLLNLDKDKVTNEQLANRMKETNEQYRVRISLLKANEAIEAQSDKVGQVEEARLKAAIRLGDELERIVEKRKLDIYVDYSDLQGTADKVKAILGEGNIKRNFFNENDTSKINNATEALVGFTKIQDIQIDKLEKVTKAYKNLTQEQKDALLTIQKEQNQVYNNQLEVLIKTATEIGGKAGKDFSIFNQDSVQKYIDKVMNAAETTSTFEEKSKDNANKRIALLEKISKIEAANNNIVLSSRDKELESITAKYKELNIEAVKLGVNLSVINRISASETAEKNVANYKFDTDALANELKKREDLYTKYNELAKNTSIESANEMYAGMIDASKDYFDYIEEEMNKINLVDMTPQEKARYTMLLGLMDDYNNKRFEKEQSYFTEIYKLTETTEQKLVALREKYSKARSGLQNSYSGNELTERLANLERESEAEFTALFKNLTERTKEFDDVSNMIVGATKNQIRSQIESLRNYLNSANDLTKEQIEAINRTIRGLETSVVSATDDNKNISGSASKFKDLRNESIRLNQEIKRLKESAKKLELFPEAAKEIAEINAQVDGLNSRLKDLPKEELLATADAFGEMSVELSTIGDLFDGVDDGVGKVFDSLSQVLRNAEKIIKAFDKMGDAIGAVGKASSSSTGESMSNISAGMGAWGAIVQAGFALAKLGADIQEQARERRHQRKLELEQLYYGELKYQQLLGDGIIKEAQRNKFLEGRRKELMATRDQLILLESQYRDIINKFNDTSKAGLTGSGLGEFGKILSEDFYKPIIQQLEEISRTGTDIQKQQAQAWLDMFNQTVKVSGKSIEELRKMQMQGLLSGESLRIFNELDEVDKKIKELGISFEDLIEIIKEMNTGTNLDELSNALSDVFLRGEDAVEEFGQTFEDVIKKAIVTSFRENYIKKEMQTLFDDLADAFADDELTNSELEALRKKAEETAKLAQQQWDRLTGGLGLDFGETTTGGNTPTDVIRKITESQANSIDGSLKGIQLVSIDSNNVLKNQLNVLLLQHETAKESVMYLVEIRNNTLATANNTARLESIENSLISIDNATNNRQAQSLGIN